MASTDELISLLEGPAQAAPVPSTDDLIAELERPEANPFRAPSIQAQPDFVKQSPPPRQEQDFTLETSSFGAPEHVAQNQEAMRRTIKRMINSGEAASPADALAKMKALEDKTRAETLDATDPGYTGEIVGALLKPGAELIATGNKLERALGVPKEYAPATHEDVAQMYPGSQKTGPQIAGGLTSLALAIGGMEAIPGKAVTTLGQAARMGGILGGQTLLQTGDPAAALKSGLVGAVAPVAAAPVPGAVGKALAQAVPFGVEGVASGADPVSQGINIGTGLAFGGLAALRARVAKLPPEQIRKIATLPAPPSRAQAKQIPLPGMGSKDGRQIVWEEAQRLTASTEKADALAAGVKGGVEARQVEALKEQQGFQQPLRVPEAQPEPPIEMPVEAAPEVGGVPRPGERVTEDAGILAEAMQKVQARKPGAELTKAAPPVAPAQAPKPDDAKAYTLAGSGFKDVALRQLADMKAKGIRARLVTDTVPPDKVQIAGQNKYYRVVTDSAVQFVKAFDKGKAPEWAQKDAAAEMATQAPAPKADIRAASDSVKSGLKKLGYRVESVKHSPVSNSVYYKFWHPKDPHLHESTVRVSDHELPGRTADAAGEIITTRPDMPVAEQVKRFLSEDVENWNEFASRPPAPAPSGGNAAPPQDVRAALKAKGFGGTIDRLDRGEITEEQARAELAGDMSHIKKAAPPNAADFAAEMKGQGVDRKVSWSRWIQRTGLNPGMDAKDWFAIYDSVTPTPPARPAPPAQESGKDAKPPKAKPGAELTKPERTMADVIDEANKKPAGEPDTTLDPNADIHTEDVPEAEQPRKLRKPGEELAKKPSVMEKKAEAAAPVVVTEKAEPPKQRTPRATDKAISEFWNAGDIDDRSKMLGIAKKHRQSYRQWDKLTDAERERVTPMIREELKRRTPEYRATQIVPLKTLGVKKSAWRGNAVTPESLFVSDGHAILSKSSLDPKALAELSVEQQMRGKVSVRAAQEVWDTGSKDAGISLDIIGTRPSDAGDIQYTYMTPKGKDAPVYMADGNKLRHLMAKTKADEVRGGRTDKMLVLYRDGKPVAGLMPIVNEKGVGESIDITAAHNRSTPPPAKGVTLQSSAVPGAKAGAELTKPKRKGGGSGVGMAGSAPALPVGGPPTPGEVVGRRDIMAYLARALDLPARFDRMGRGHLGEYKPKADVIRTVGQNIAVFAHEVGHKLDGLFNLSHGFGGRANRSGKQPFDAELIPMGKATSLPSYQKWQIRDEGVAEFFRLWFTDPAKAASDAPLFSKRVETTLNAQPAIKEMLDRGRELYRQYQTQGPLARVMSTITTPEEVEARVRKAQGWKERASTAWNSIYSGVFDRIDPIKRFTKEAEAARGEGLHPTQDPYKLASLIPALTSKYKYFVEDGTLDFATGKPNGESLYGLLGDLRGKPEKIREFEAYLKARRATERGEQQIGLEPGDAKAVYDQLHGEYEPMAEKFTAWNDRIIKYAVDGGYIAPETAAAWRKGNALYAPMRRVMEAGIEEPGGLAAGRGKGLMAKEPGAFKALKGSTRPTYSPLAAAIDNMTTIISAVERNRVLQEIQRLADTTQGMGDWAESVPPKKFAIELPDYKIEDIVKRLAEDGVTMTPDEVRAMVTAFAPTYNISAKENIIPVVWKGKTRMLQLSPEMFRAVTDMDADVLSPVLKFMSFPAQITRAGVILDPSFAVRNVARDALASSIVTDYGFNPTRSVVGAVKMVMNEVTPQEIVQEFKAAGGPFAGTSYYDMDAITKRLKSELTAKHPASNLILHHPMMVLRALMDASESATRVGQFEQAKASKEMPSSWSEKDRLTEAVFVARDLMNFGRRGRWMKIPSATIPFFNPFLQGWDKGMRALKKDPKKVLLRSSAITASSVLLYLAIRKDEEYQEVPLWEKIGFWHVRPNPTGPLYRIPKPFEFGIAFGSAPVYALDRILSQKGAEGDKAAERFLSALGPNSLIPAAMKLPIELMSNYDFFRDAPIIPEYMKDLPPEQQVSPYTSTVSRMVGGFFGVSPLKVEHALKTGGGLFKKGLTASEWALDKAGASQVRDLEPLSSLNPLATLVSHSAERTPASVDRFYSLLESERVSDARKERSAYRWMNQYALQMREWNHVYRTATDPQRRKDAKQRVLALAQKALDRYDR